MSQGRHEEGEALLLPALRTLESFGYRTAAAAGSVLGRARVFAGDYESGREMIERAGVLFDEAHWLAGSYEARVRLAEIAVYAGDVEQPRPLTSARVSNDRWRFPARTARRPG